MSKNPIELPRNLAPVTETELRQVEGAALTVGGDGYCGTPWLWPRPFVTDLGSTAVAIR